MIEKSVLPRPSQNTIANGLLNDKSKPVVKLLREEIGFDWGWVPFTASLIAWMANQNSSTTPSRLAIIRTTEFWTRKASPVNAITAQVASPRTEPICTNQADQNPCDIPRRTVSAVTTPGGAQ